jgi:hypothetical protein
VLGSREVKKFDPYAFAVRWYEDHPEALVEYERALGVILKIAGIRLDELEDIEAKALEFGRLVRESETRGREPGQRFVKSRHDWVAFRDNLPHGVKAEAQLAFDRGYIP